MEIKTMTAQVRELGVGWHCWKPQLNPCLLMKHPFKASQMLQRASTSYKNNQAVSQEWICSTGLVWLKSQAVLLCKKCSVCAWERGESILVEATLALSDTHLVRPWSCCEQEEFPGVQKSDITCTLLMAVSEATSRLICRNFFCNRQNLCKIPISLPWPVRSFSWWVNHW